MALPTQWTSLGKLQELVIDTEALVCCGLWGRKESETTQ